MELAIHQFVQHLPIGDDQKAELRTATLSDSVLQRLTHVLKTEWPNNIINVPQDVREYWNVRNEIHAAENLLFMGDRLIVPASKRSSVLQLIHEPCLINNGFCLFKAFQASQVLSVGLTMDTILFLIE